MGLQTWSERLDRRAQDGARRPYVAPVYLGGAVALGLFGAFRAESPAGPLTFAAVWGALAVVSLVVARARDRR